MEIKVNFKKVSQEFEVPNNAMNVSLDKNFIKLRGEIEYTRTFIGDYCFLQLERNFIISLTPFETTCNVNDILISAEQTLESIVSCCSLGNFSDAYVLLRKYRDDLFFHLYILLASHENGKNFQSWLDSGSKDGSDLSELRKNNKQTENIKKWLSDKLENLHISDVLKCIATSQELSEAVHKYNLKTSFDNIGKKLNDFVHANGVSYYNKPYSRYRDSELEKLCNNFQESLDYITVTFLFLSSLCNPLSIMSSDYIDAFDFGETTPENSSYWVAPFVQDYFQQKIKFLDQNGLKYLQDKTGMQIMKTCEKL